MAVTETIKDIKFVVSLLLSHSELQKYNGMQFLLKF